MTYGGRPLSPKYKFGGYACRSNQIKIETKSLALKKKKNPNNINFLYWKNEFKISKWFKVFNKCFEMKREEEVESDRVLMCQSAALSVLAGWMTDGKPWWWSVQCALTDKGNDSIVLNEAFDVTPYHVAEVLQSCALTRGVCGCQQACRNRRDTGLQLNVSGNMTAGCKNARSSAPALSDKAMELRGGCGCAIAVQWHCSS